MNSISTDLVFTCRQPRNRSMADHAPVLILLHGRGANEDDLLPIAEAHDGRCEVYSLRAPYEYEFGGYTWFAMNDELSADTTTFNTSYTKLRSFIGQFKKRKIFLLGFSMGSVLAYHLALTSPNTYRGIIAHSGIVPEQALEMYRWNELASCAFFISHGTYDPIIPIGYGRRAEQLFKSSTAPYIYKEYSMGHEVNSECLEDSKRWLSTLVDT